MISDDWQIPLALLLGFIGTVAYLFTIAANKKPPTAPR